jgi:hypothetical protein
LRGGECYTLTASGKWKWRYYHSSRIRGRTWRAATGNDAALQRRTGNNPAKNLAHRGQGSQWRNYVADARSPGFPRSLQVGSSPEVGSPLLGFFCLVGLRLHQRRSAFPNKLWIRPAQSKRQGLRLRNGLWKRLPMRPFSSR